MPVRTLLVNGTAFLLLSWLLDFSPSKSRRYCTDYSAGANRLKTSLNLPKIEPRPPCPPRVYARLYAYFERELTSTGRKRGRRSRITSTPMRPLPERHLPSRERGLEGFKTNRTPRQGLRYGGNKTKEKLPKWVPPAIRVLCAGLDAGRAVPHVIAGVESVLFLPCPGAEDADGDQSMREAPEGEGGEGGLKRKIPALIGAVLAFVIVRLTGQQTDAKEYNQRVRTILGLLRGLREDEAIAAKVGEREDAWDGWEPITKKDVDGWLKEISSKGWLRMDWWENMVDGSGASGQAEEVDEEDDEDIDEDVRTRGMERERLWHTRSGTMKQDQVDYLSETQRERYAKWKELMLAKIDSMVEGGILNGGKDTTVG
jgi:origin recognition complex subunit 6